MRSVLAGVVLMLLLTSGVHADVRLYGNLNIQDSSTGAIFLGEIANSTDTPVTMVKVTVTAKDNLGAVIDEASGYVNGYRDHELSSDSYIVPGYLAPFKIYGSVDADEIASYDVTISYQTTDAVHPDLSEVNRISETTSIDTSTGITFYGEISNDSPNFVYFAKVTIVLRDGDGNVVDVDYTYVDGEDYRLTESIYTDTLIQPGEAMPFRLMTDAEAGDVAAFYTIITYHIGEPGRYHYFGENDVTLVDGLTMTGFYDLYVKYTGEIENGTERDLYYAGITVVSRDSDGKIVDVSNGYVDGTPFDISETLNTDTHIAPGESASFDIMAMVAPDDVASYEYIITYRYAGDLVGIEEDAPQTFMLVQNYPNPFNAATTIPFVLSEAARVRLEVYNIGGQRVAELVDGRLDAGQHVATWDASSLPSGMYFSRLSANGQVITRKMTMVK